MPGLDHIRSQSLFGSRREVLLQVGNDYWAVRQEVINRLQFVSLPNGIRRALAVERDRRGVPLHARKGKGYTSGPEDGRGLDPGAPVAQVDGVIDVTSFGGETKEYHVEVDPFRCGARGHAQPGHDGHRQRQPERRRRRLVIGEQSYDIRGIGLIQNVHDIENIVVAEQKGVPVRVRDVANVDIGYAPRLGIVGHDDDDDVVQGIVLMRYGGETPSTLEGVHKRVELHPQEPPPAARDGLVPYYDRGKLVKLTTHTVIENLVVGMASSSLVLFLFLGNTRARSSRRSTSRSRSSSRSSAWSRRARRRTSSRSARSTSASSSTRPSS
jgi:cobalt-zinc-cadmium resistance protein CzcA